MVQPAFVQVRSTPENSPVFLVDIPRDMNLLLLWMYDLSKEASFPVKMNLMGKTVTFGSHAEMLGYAKGLKQTSEVLFEDEALFA